MGRKRLWKREIVNGEHWCYRCDAWKPVGDFYPDKKASVGLRGRCKECDKYIVNSMHSNNLDRAMGNLLIRHKSNGRHGSNRRHGFTESGCLTHEVLKEMWDRQDGKCAVTGVQLTHIQGKGYRIWTNVTVDRIDPDNGYVRDNIRLVCRAVNYMKAAMTDDDMIKWAQLILSGPVASQRKDTPTDTLRTHFQSP